MPWHAWLLIGLSGLVSLGSGGLGLLLGSMFLGSHDGGDRRIGLVILALSVAWMGLPVLAGWLWWLGRHAVGAALTVAILLMGCGLVVLLLGALEAAARP